MSEISELYEKALALVQEQAKELAQWEKRAQWLQEREAYPEDVSNEGGPQTCIIFKRLNPAVHSGVDEIWAYGETVADAIDAAMTKDLP